MAYESLRDSVFNDESKMLKLFVGTLGGFLVLALIFSEKGGPKYWLIGSCVAALLVLLVVVKRFVRPLPCHSCAHNIRPAIMELGKEASKGYCPKCGHEIA